MHGSHGIYAAYSILELNNCNFYNTDPEKFPETN